MQNERSGDFDFARREELSFCGLLCVLCVCVLVATVPAWLAGNC